MKKIGKNSLKKLRKIVSSTDRGKNNFFEKFFECSSLWSEKFFFLSKSIDFSLCGNHENNYLFNIFSKLEHGCLKNFKNTKFDLIYAIVW